MKIIADLHLHSKYSRAVSGRMVIPKMAQWARKKGIDLLATGDWTHPLWFKELTANLEEAGEGIYKVRRNSENSVNQKISESAGQKTSGPYFLLSTEISSIYSQGGQTRRIHNLVLAPSLATVEKINQALVRRGGKLMSDGRPIISLSSEELTELVLEVDEDCLVIPAHCLLPETPIHTNPGTKKIKKIKPGDKVFTHKGRYRKVKKVFTRPFKGRIYQIIPDYFRLGITVTSEHPFWAIKTVKDCRSISKTLGLCRPTCPQRKNCARRYFGKYQPQWVQAKDLEKGDILLYPRFSKTKDIKFIKISDFIEDFVSEEKGKISPGGYRRHKIPDKIKIDEGFCRLIGYYLAEGYTTRDLVSFCFSQKERGCLEEIKRAFKAIFGIENYREKRQRRGYRAIELAFYSKILHRLFSNLFYKDPDTRTASDKCLPNWMLWLPVEKQKEILLGWWRGDKGYTTSRLLMNQMKIICLRLGIIPSVGKDSKQDHKNRGKHKIGNRKIKATHDIYHFSNLSFFGNPFNLLDKPVFKEFKTKTKRRRGWMDEDYVYLPIRKIVKEDYHGEVYNLEVEEDNSYTAEFACIHNCWTPWYSLYGSQSGFDSLEECFGKMSKHIYALETGLSSDPAMNWRIKELDKRSIVSFSDAHSPEKLGREATVFEVEDTRTLGYEDIRKAIVNGEIAYTIEFYPQEGKYHYTGHRKCQVRQSPEETKKLGSTCPVCGQKLTVGVMHRVQQLAARPSQTQKEAGKTKALWVKDKGRPPYVMLVPLMEILSEALEVGVSSQNVKNEYNKLTKILGPEFQILLRAKPEEIAQIAGLRVAEGVLLARSGQVVIEPGYDGVFGTVKIWGEKKKEEKKQMSLF